MVLPLVFAVALPAIAAKKDRHHAKPKERPHPVKAAATPPPQPRSVPDEDMTGAVPANHIDQLPSTAEQFKALSGEIAKTKPAVDSAKQKSDTLNAQALALRNKLMATVARVQMLEAERNRLDDEIARLQKKEATESATFAHDRVAVSHLLAVLERLQYDMPPAMALKPDDALGAARGSMLIGTSVPRVYEAAAELARRIKTLRETRSNLMGRRADGLRNAVQIARAGKELDQLLAIKEREAGQASGVYSSLQAKLDAVGGQAKDLAALLARVAHLRTQPAGAGVVVVGPESGSALGALRKGVLLRPAVGRMVSGGVEGLGGAGAPGVTFLTSPGAPIIAPTDAQVLFAGPYHKTGQVLILESAGGYDLVLAGLERLAVRPDDQLLAGEPLGTMPRTKDARLYFELRQNGKGLNPAPWLAVELRKANKS